MLPKHLRMTRTLANEVFKTGRSFYNQYFSLRVVLATNQETKVLIVAPAKAINQATKRNKVKRRVRYLVIKNKARLKPGYLVAVLIKKEALTLPYSLFETKLNQLFNQAHLLY